MLPPTNQKRSIADALSKFSTKLLLFHPYRPIPPLCENLGGHRGELSRNGAIPSTHHIQRARLGPPPEPRRRRLHKRASTTQDVRLRSSARHLGHRIMMGCDPRVALSVPIEIIPDARRKRPGSQDDRGSSRGTVTVDGDLAISS